MAKRKILVTGGAGFIGSSFCERLSRDSDNLVVAVDNLLTGKVEHIAHIDSPNFKFIQTDVNNFQEISTIMISHQFDFVFHLAAVVGVQRTLANPLMVFRDIDGIENILNLSKNLGVKRVFFSSSSEVYGEPFEFPQDEHTTPLNSRLPYAVVKNIGEAYLKAYSDKFNLAYTIFRFFNTYGPRQSDDFVISKFVRAALQDQNITIYGDGSQTRTFLYVDDNVSACMNIFYDNAFINDTVNIGSSQEYSILDVAQLVIDITDSSSKIVHLPPLKEGDMTRRKPLTAKMQSILDKKLVPLQDGIRTFIDVNYGARNENMLSARILDMQPEQKTALSAQKAV